MNGLPPHTPGYTAVMAEVGARLDLAIACGWDASLGAFVAEALWEGQVVGRAVAGTDIEALAALRAELEHDGTEGP